MNKKQVIVVGNGPSLEGKGLGLWIDSFDIVVKMNNGHFDKDYGFKGNYLISTTRSVRKLALLDPSNVEVVWLFKTARRGGRGGRKRSVERYAQIIHNYGYGGEVIHINAPTRLWVKWYKKRRNKTKQSSPKVFYPSKGTMAVLSAIKLLDVKEIFVAGFDHVFFNTPWGSVGDTGDPDGLIPFNHDRRVECQVIELASRERAVKITVVVPELSLAIDYFESLKIKKVL